MSQDADGSSGGVFDQVLPALGFNAKSLMEIGEQELLRVIFPNCLAAANWWGGFWNNSLSKLGLFKPLLSIKSPIQGTNIAPPIGLPGIGSSKSR